MAARMATWCFILLAAGCAAAISTDPNAVPAPELQGMISGRSVRIGADTATYSVDGRYTYKGGNPGSYTVTNGTICVNFDTAGGVPGRRRCDQVLRSGKGFVFVTETGDRVPFRPI